MKFKLIAFLMLVSVAASAQFTNYTRIANRYRYLAGAFDSTFTPPLYNGTPSGVRVGTPAISGHFVIDTANGRPYIYQSGSWQRLAKFSEITGGNLYVDSLWRIPGKDSIFWLKNGTTYKFKDSTGATPTLQQVLATESNSAVINSTDISPTDSTQSIYFGDYIRWDIFDVRTNKFKVSAIDSARLQLDGGKLNIDSLRSTSDTNSYKPIVRGEGGQVRQLTSWPGSGSTLFAENGLTKSGDTVRLGGTLGRNTTIEGDGSYTLTLNPSKLYIPYTQTAAGHTAAIKSDGEVGYVIDTITIAAFGAGSGAAGDTAAFTTDALYGSFWHDKDTLVITSVYAVIQAGATDTLGVQIYFNDSLNTGTTGVLSSTLALTSRPQGWSSTSFANQKIAPGNWVWCKSPTIVAGRKPEYLSVSLIGYRKRRN